MFLLLAVKITGTWSLVTWFPPCSVVKWIVFCRWKMWCLQSSVRRSVWLTSVSMSRIISDCNRSSRKRGKTGTKTANQYLAHLNHTANEIFCMSRLQFESQRTRLSTQQDYEQAQLEKHVTQMKKLKETIHKEENIISSLKKANRLTPVVTMFTAINHQFFCVKTCWTGFIKYLI